MIELSTRIDWSKIHVKENEVIRRLVAVFSVEYDRGPRDLEVRVWELSPDTVNEKVPFFGELNYWFWGPLQFDKYLCLHPTGSVETALETALSTYRSYDRPAEYPPETIAWWKPDLGKDQFIDGTGTRVTASELASARAKFESPQ